MVVDIGGGSTELIGGDQRVSLDIGSVRLTERHPPLRSTDRDGARRVRRGRAHSLPDGPRPEQAIGVAGTITSLAALDLGLAEYDPERVHGHRLTLDGVQQQLSRLASMPLAERRQVPASIPIARR